MTAPSLLDELEEVVRLAEKATPGPFVVDGYGDVTANGEDVARIASDGYSAYHDAHLFADAANFIRAHHAEIADMAKRLETTERTLERCKQTLDTTSECWRLDAERLEAAERDAAELRMCKGEYAMPDGTIAKCHVNVGVNVWHGERWLAFHECSPDQLRLIIDDAAQEGEG